MRWNDPLYRVRQFFSAAHATPLTGQESERVRAVLNDEGFALYQSMPLGDQRHSLKILDALLAQGYTARPLLQAALLHDVAKRRVGLGYRTGVILLNKFAPGGVARLASAAPRSWRYPFYVSLHHPELGAQLAAQVGLEAGALELIRSHQENAPTFKLTFHELEPKLHEWHTALKQLDDVN